MTTLLHPSRPNAKCPCLKNFLKDAEHTPSPLPTLRIPSHTCHLFAALFTLFSGQLWETGVSLACLMLCLQCLHTVGTLLEQLFGQGHLIT